MNRLTRIAEAIAATALAAIFIVFLLQIFTRYSGKLSQWMPVENLSLWMSEIEPLRWTVYLISLLWVWLIFLGCSFVVRERDHVAFDILYQAAPPRSPHPFPLPAATPGQNHTRRDSGLLVGNWYGDHWNAVRQRFQCCIHTRMRDH